MKQAGTTLCQDLRRGNLSPAFLSRVKIGRTNFSLLGEIGVQRSIRLVVICTF